MSLLFVVIVDNPFGFGDLDGLLDVFAPLIIDAGITFFGDIFPGSIGTEDPID